LFDRETEPRHLDVLALDARDETLERFRSHPSTPGRFTRDRSGIDDVRKCRTAISAPDRYPGH
jgi:hypothetical protein